MPKRKEPELDPKEQFKRFVETAHDHGVDEFGKEFERAFNTLQGPSWVDAVTGTHPFTADRMGG